MTQRVMCAFAATWHPSEITGSIRAMIEPNHS